VVCPRDLDEEKKNVSFMERAGKKIKEKAHG
jgi:hypothetical protein